MKSAQTNRAVRTAGLVLLAVSALLLLAGCPANGVKEYLLRATGFEGNVYVNGATGSDENVGSIAAPLATIQAGIARGQWYLANGVATAVSVLVAAGTYEVDDSAGNGVSIAEGVSLYGGYATDFSGERDPGTHVTIIKDLSTTGEEGESGEHEVDNVAIVADGRENPITTATVIDGFTIIGGTSDNGSAYTVLCETASPTISNNIIDAGGGYVTIYVYNGSDPVISDNTIIGSLADTDTWSWKVTVLVSTDCEPVITGNTIGAVGDSIWGQTAIRVVNGSDARIEENVITASTETTMAYPAEGIAVGTGGTGAVGSIGRIFSNTIIAPIGITSWGEDTYLDVEENTITCSNSTGYSRGIEAGPGDTIRGNTITCDGTGTASTGVTAGVMVVTSGSGSWLTILGNTISAKDTGATPYEVVGVQAQGAGEVILMENVISVGPAMGGQGVRITNCAGTGVDHNIITTTGMTEHVSGLDLVETPGTIDHNVITPSGASALCSTGMQIQGTAPSSGDIRIRNNTIYGGGAAEESFGIILNGCNLPPEIDNNIILTGGGASTAQFAIVEGSIDVSLRALRNNLFFRYTGSMLLFYDDEDFANGGSVSDGVLDTIVALEEELSAEGVTAENNLDSGVVGLPVDGLPVFVDIDGPDNDFDTMEDNDWHLMTGTPAAIYGGGLTVEAGATDLAGVVRTVPWSIGAYEYDG